MLFLGNNGSLWLHICKIFPTKANCATSWPKLISRVECNQIFTFTRNSSKLNQSKRMNNKSTHHLLLCSFTLPKSTFQLIELTSSTCKANCNSIHHNSSLLFVLIFFPLSCCSRTEPLFQFIHWTGVRGARRHISTRKAERKGFFIWFFCVKFFSFALLFIKWRRWRWYFASGIHFEWKEEKLQILRLQQLQFGMQFIFAIYPLSCPISADGQIEI